MKIRNAIIIHGPGRSGTTLVSSIISLHESLGWISGYLNKFPELNFLASLNRLNDVKIIEKYTRGKRRMPRPSEAYQYWNHFEPNFDKYSYNIKNNNIELISNNLRKVLKYSGKERFITKLTGLSRYEFLNELFDNPYVIWVDRNPESVILSYYKQRWNYKSKPDIFKSKETKDLLDEYISMYNLFQEEKKMLQKFQFKTVQYEDLVKNKFNFFKDICEFTKLDYNQKFINLIDSWEIKKSVDSQYQNFLNDINMEYLRKQIQS